MKRLMHNGSRPSCSTIHPSSFSSHPSAFILHPSSFILQLSSFILLTVSGCNIVGAVAAKTIPETVAPKYVGLQDQTIGVMVWADRAVRIDWDTIQLDVANAVQTGLRASKSAKELKGASFPVQPASIARFQFDHPELESAPVTDFAAQIGVSRLLYIELEAFSTRSEVSYQLYRGSAIATLRVVEIAPDGKARVAYEENGITAGFPLQGPAEGEINGSDAVFYRGTVQALAEEIGKRLVTTQVR